MKYFLFVFLLALFPLFGFGQSKTLQELKDSNQVQLGLYFTPSTLRMFNILKDTAYDEMVRGIDKLDFLIMHPEKFAPELYYETTDKLINQEQYEEYIILDGDEYQMNVLGKPKEQKMIGLAYYQDAYYIFDLKGTIDLMQLPAFYKTISSQDSTLQNGFSYIFNMIQKDETDRLRRKRRNKEWEERQKKEEEEEKQKTKADSVALKSEGG